MMKKLKSKLVSNLGRSGHCYSQGRDGQEKEVLVFIQQRLPKLAVPPGSAEGSPTNFAVVSASRRLLGETV